jgi:predicted ATPase
VDPDEPAAPAAIIQPIFEDVGTRIQLSHCDLGFGLTQALPVLVNAAALSNRIIAVEQPELHLHPAQQSELGDVFIESALGERKNTFLLETHSEHLILRVMRRMRETANGTLKKGLPGVRPQDVAVVFVEARKQGEKTGSFVRVLELDEEGQLLDPWPGGFFEEGFRERFS